jgi:hypothetical protein
MTKPILHAPQKDSPSTVLVVGINDTDTVLSVGNAVDFVTDNITRLVLGIDEDETEVVEVVSYGEDPSGDPNHEITVIRGPDALAWPAGTLVARTFTSEDLEEVQEFLDYLDDTLMAHDHVGGEGSLIPSEGIEDAAVIESKIGASAVTNTKLGASAVTEAKIADGAVTNTKLGSNAVTASKIQNDAVTNAKLEDPYDIIYCSVIDFETELEIFDGLAYFFIPEVHNTKIAVKLWAGITNDLSSSGDVVIRFYNVTNAETMGSVTIPAGSRTATLTVSYELATNDRIRIDCTSQGVGVTGLDVQIKVDKT